MNSKDIIIALNKVGYSNLEIAKHTQLTQQTLSSIVSGRRIPRTLTKIKLQEFFDQNVEEVPIGSLEYLDSVLIETPDGWQRTGSFFHKGVLECLKVKAGQFEICGSTGHLVQLSSGQWIPIKDVKVNDVLLSREGESKVSSITPVGKITCVDVEVLHSNHRYFVEGISSHNSGKSYLAACVAASALEMGYDHVFYFDSEGGALRSFFENRGCDVSKIEHVLVENVEDAEVKILAVYKKIEEIKKSFPGMRFLCIYDSLGASVAKKVFNDAANGKVVSDMGSRARLVNNMMKALIIPALKTDTTIIVINHVYDNPASLFTQKIQNQGGGKAVQYLARITLQCTKKYEKSGGENGYYKATVLKFFSVKNSIVKPFFDTEMYLDFSKGPNPYYGIIRPAIESGFLVPQKGGVRVPLCNNAFFTMPALLDPSRSKQMWDVVLPELDKVFSEKMSYSGPPSDEEELLEEAKAAADAESESIAATLELPGEGSPETPEQAEKAQAEKP